MTRLMTVVWLAQFFLFLALGICFLLLPFQWHAWLHNYSLQAMMQEPSFRPEAAMVVCTLRIVSPLALTLALFSSHAAMRDDLDRRRQLAKFFALTLGFYAFLLYGEKAQPLVHTRHIRTLFAVISAFALLNFIAGFLPVHRDRERPLSGMADTRPAQLWLLWLAQGLCSLLVAGGILLAANSRHGWSGLLHDLVLRAQPLSESKFSEFVTLAALRGQLHARDLILDQLESLPPYCLGLGLLSFYAMRSSREWVWRLLARLFTATYAFLLLVYLLAWDGDVFRPWPFVLFGVPALGFLIGNRVFAGAPGEYFTRDVGQGPDGWTVTDLAAGPLLVVRTLLRGGRRPHHQAGVGARGYFLVAASPPAFPAHDFFKSARRFAVRVRFSSATSDDDASLDTRGVALRFSNREQSQLDLCLATGAFAEAENMAQFLRLLVVGGLGKLCGRRLRFADLQVREAAIAGLRRAPDCFSKLHYYSQIVRFWVSRDDVRYLVRYRLVPEDPSIPESGLPAATDDLHDHGRLPSERRAADYLRRELKRRLELAQPLRLRLQGQFHRPQPGDDLHWYNPGVDWHAGDHPFVDIGVVVLMAALPDEETERLRFNPANHPPSLGTPSSNHPWDYRSLADSERRVVSRVQNLRRWLSSVLGVPTPASQRMD